MKISRLVFPAILLVYGLLYLATTKKLNCDDNCMKYSGIDTMVRKNRPYVIASFHCQDTSYCVFVSDSVPRNWSLLADTTCVYMQAVSLPRARVIVTSTRTGDTLVSKKCP